jgi:hypothetical protein
MCTTRTYARTKFEYGIDRFVASEDASVHLRLQFDDGHQASRRAPQKLLAVSLLEGTPFARRRQAARLSRS